MANMFDMPKQKACPIVSAAVGMVLMNHATDDRYKAIVLQDTDEIVNLGRCMNAGCAWWDDSRQCCGVISK